MQNFLRDATEFFPILLQGVRLTIIVTVGSLLLSTALGLLWALLRVSGLRVLHQSALPNVGTLCRLPSGL